MKISYITNIPLTEISGGMSGINNATFNQLSKYLHFFMNKTIIISPSGNLYGSENVLLDFLKSTKNQYIVFIKFKGLLFNKAQKETKHIIKSFNSEKLLYLKLFFILLLQNPIRTVYVNEGGHIRYIKIFAKIFNRRKFLVHIRIKEDTYKNRLGVIPKNIELIAVSQYLQSLIGNEYKCSVIYDPYELVSQTKNLKTNNNKTFNIAIIGRVTKTKELDSIFPILKSLQNKSEKSVIFNFWGNYLNEDTWFKEFKQKLLTYSNINLKGFAEDKEQIFINSNLVIHLNTVEALGRIIFEAIDCDTPIITFNKGGAGELMKVLSLDKLIIEKENNWDEKFTEKIIELVKGAEYMQEIKFAKNIIANDFKPEYYTTKIEQLF